MTEGILPDERLTEILGRRGVRRVFSALAAPGEETRLVGGCVRDALLGISPDDTDLATTQMPADAMARARKAGLTVVPTGIAHGTLTIIAEGEVFEVTTLREDIETDGRHAVVRFGRDFGLDAARRDFTINALSADANGRLYDTTGGVADLKAGRVRFIGDAAARIREDALRILRFFRFHARYGAGAPDAAGLAACIAAAAALDGLSRERVRSEVLKLLVAPHAVGVLTIMSRTGLLSRIVGSDGHLDRLARVVARSAPSSASGRLAALAIGSRDDVPRLRDALRLSNEETALLDAYAAALSDLAGSAALERGDVRRLAATHTLPALVLAVDAEAVAISTEDGRAYWEDLRRGAKSPPVFPLTGGDLVALGMRAGPAVGRGLAAAKASWLAQGCPEGDDVRALLVARAREATASG